MEITDEERRRRIEEAIAKERDAPPCWWYLSFVDPRRPAGKRFIGVCWVKAGGPATAIRRAHAFGVNPGGQVAFLALPFKTDPPESSANTLHRKRDEIDRLCQLWGDQEEKSK